MKFCTKTLEKRVWRGRWACQKHCSISSWRTWWLMQVSVMETFFRSTSMSPYYATWCVRASRTVRCRNDFSIPGGQWTTSSNEWCSKWLSSCWCGSILLRLTYTQHHYDCTSDFVVYPLHRCDWWNPRASHDLCSPRSPLPWSNRCNDKNNLIAVNLDGNVTFCLSGWEGYVHNSRMLEDARQHGF